MTIINYSLGLIFINIFIYLLLLLNFFIIFFIYDTRYFRTLNEFKGLNGNQYIHFIVILIFLSFAGMPPLLGFFGKFFIIIFFFSQKQFFIFVLFLFLNVFVIYFYILNIRFLVSKTSNTFFFLKKNVVFLNFNFIFLLVVFTTINVFSFFFIYDLILFFNFICIFNF